MVSACWFFWKYSGVYYVQLSSCRFFSHSQQCHIFPLHRSNHWINARPEMDMDALVMDNTLCRNISLSLLRKPYNWRKWFRHGTSCCLCSWFLSTKAIRRSQMSNSPSYYQHCLRTWRYSESYGTFLRRTCRVSLFMVHAQTHSQTFLIYAIDSELISPFCESASSICFTTSAGGVSVVSITRS